MKLVTLISAVNAVPADYYEFDQYSLSYNYADYNSNEYTLDYGDLDKGKKKKQQFEQQSKQQLSPDVVTAENSAYNGHQCWTCNSESYELCQSQGQMAYCESEEFNCYIREHKLFENVVKVHMGCQQTHACHREFQNNNRFYGMDMPDIAGFNSANFQQCFPEDNSQNVSICRQCCATFQCNQAWKDGSLDTDSEWNDTSDHEVSA